MTREEMIKYVDDIYNKCYNFDKKAHSVVIFTKDMIFNTWEGQYIITSDTYSAVQCIETKVESYNKHKVEFVIYLDGEHYASYVEGIIE